MAKRYANKNIISISVNPGTNLFSHDSAPYCVLTVA